MKCFKISEKIGRIYSNQHKVKIHYQKDDIYIYIYIYINVCIVYAIMSILSNTVLLVLLSCTLPWFYYILFNLTFSVEALLAVKYSKCLIIGPCFA